MNGKPRDTSIPSSTPMGFTLIELLVVISIIALLIGILLPALGAARKSAMSLQCLTQQRQFGMGLSMFADEHKDYLPKAWFNGGPTQEDDTSWGFEDPNWGWDYVLWDGYLGQNTDIFRDPADEDDGLRVETPLAIVSLPDSYRYNISDLLSQEDAMRVDDLRRPTESIRILDSAPGHLETRWHHVATWEGGRGGIVRPDFPENVALDRHPSNSNYTFADGHAASASWEETWKDLLTNNEWKGQQTMWRQNFDGLPDR